MFTHVKDCQTTAEYTHLLFMKKGHIPRTSTFVQGIIGISPFASIFDLVISIPVEYMHAVCEGVTRWHGLIPNFINHHSILVVVLQKLMLNY